MSPLAATSREKLLSSGVNLLLSGAVSACFVVGDVFGDFCVLRKSYKIAPNFRDEEIPVLFRVFLWFGPEILPLSVEVGTPRNRVREIKGLKTFPYIRT